MAQDKFSFIDRLRQVAINSLDPALGRVYSEEVTRLETPAEERGTPSAEYLAYSQHVEAVKESLKTFGAPVPQKPAMPSPVPPPRTSLTEEELREMMRARASREIFFPDKREEQQQ